METKGLTCILIVKLANTDLARMLILLFESLVIVRKHLPLISVSVDPQNLLAWLGFDFFGAILVEYLFRCGTKFCFNWCSCSACVRQLADCWEMICLIITCKVKIDIKYDEQNKLKKELEIWLVEGER